MGVDGSGVEVDAECLCGVGEEAGVFGQAGAEIGDGDDEFCDVVGVGVDAGEVFLDPCVEFVGAHGVSAFAGTALARRAFPSASPCRTEGGQALPRFLLESACPVRRGFVRRINESA